MAAPPPPHVGANGNEGPVVAPECAPPPRMPNVGGLVGAVRAPRDAVGWELVQVSGGWFHFSAELGRLDAHCGQHSGGCKMDRTLKKGTIGLSMAWLSHVCESKDQHDGAKVLLSFESARQQL